MAITTEQLTQMESAYYSGHKSVSFNGRTVVYQDMAQLWQAILVARQELAAGTPAAQGGPRRFTFTTMRGF
ncbi:hypothetical protein QTI51_04050 [Variovorax sp. J22G73]|jgi:hypothetical protein|uniref:phage head-tail joining protein n=1 Tax=unclassified Variovorax TaxID=663243 RepID=UPI0025770967|nr:MULTISPECIES: hypothetical protein [unclassified Variovorax]MDM0003899.1 hypothetical protein [Variovorax sp. J22R203]MDM0096435.1 hypothetical protein [Variovorax sp. J22G73]